MDLYFAFLCFFIMKTNSQNLTHKRKKAILFSNLVFQLKIAKVLTFLFIVIGYRYSSMNSTRKIADYQHHFERIDF